MAGKYHAPRLESFWRKLEGQLLTMLKDHWPKFDFPLGKIVKIDLAKTPLAALADQADFVGAVAKRISMDTVEILAYRHDPKDTPNEINAYRYFAHEAFPKSRDLMELVNKASTNADANLVGYLGETVFFTYAMLPAGQHHLEDLPEEVREVLNLG